MSAVSHQAAAMSGTVRGRRRRALAPAEVLLSPFRLLAVHRRTIYAFVRRDIHGRYVTSVLGLSWAVIQPLTLLMLYTFVFSYVLKIRLGGTTSTKSFALYLFCGMLPWIAFSEGVVRSANVILEHAHLIKKVVFPSEILPAFAVTSALVMEALGLAVLLIAVQLFHDGLDVTLFALPVVIVMQVMLTMGFGWFVASLNVFLRDVGQVLGLTMTLWMFMTPIFYPPEAIPARAHWVLTVNPLYHAVESYRSLILERRMPPIEHFVILGVMALAAFFAGHWFFRRSKNAFVEVL
jgi:ABC-type polysaccharide/polyol phosphate export permease